MGHGSWPLNGSWTATSTSYSSDDTTAPAAQGCTTFRRANHPQAGSGYVFITKELEVFALQ